VRSGELRRPAVAGQFYEGSARKLQEQVDSLLVPAAEPVTALAAVVPHAGFMYSGSVAGRVYGAMRPADVYILVGPNHTGLGVPVSLMSFGEWEIPGQRLPIAYRVAQRLLTSVEFAEEEEQAHKLEHSLEVQLPFVKRVSPNAKIVPIVIGDTRLETCIALGRGLAQAVVEDTRSVLLVASSDMSHYVPDTLARELDQKALDRIRALDPEGLHRVVKNLGISMCGVAPTTAVLAAAVALGAEKADVVAYMTSGDISGDRDRVVGYAGVVIT